MYLDPNGLFFPTTQIRDTPTPDLLKSEVEAV